MHVLTGGALPHEVQLKKSYLQNTQSDDHYAGGTVKLQANAMHIRHTNTIAIIVKKSAPY